MGSLVALAVMAAVSVLLGNAVASRVLRPLRTITAATRRISAENLHERLAVPGPPMRSRTSPTPSTDYWSAWKRPSPPSAGSSRTPPTNCAHHWPPCGHRST
ncbi:HAMP domain-containing protein [Nonomuraea dietziae]|uniref:HAMP domain-containing protein n=1 Tax=Nonomuraea dietziae TaxID=65515 RepID=UPI0031E01DCA